MMRKINKFTTLLLCFYLNVFEVSLLPESNFPLFFLANYYYFKFKIYDS